MKNESSLPSVSIVTPSYNQGRFLKRTIDSVLNQTYPHIEYRVCDGGSTDDSVAILKSYGDRFPWVSERDRGQAHAINKGFAGATGEIRAYLNSDDVLLPDAVEKAVNWFTAHPTCDMVYGHGLYIDEQDALTGEYNTLDYSFERMMVYCIVCQPAAFWTTRIAQKIGDFDESLHFALDYDYWLRIDRAGGRIEHLPEPLACSRMYPQTKTASGQVKFTDEIIRVCLKNAGWVNFSAVQGYWYQRCFESKTGWPSYFGKRGEQLPLLLARMHHVWLNRRNRHLGRALHGLTRHTAILVRDQMRGLLRQAS